MKEQIIKKMINKVVEVELFKLNKMRGGFNNEFIKQKS